MDDQHFPLAAQQQQQQQQSHSQHPSTHKNSPHHTRHANSKHDRKQALARLRPEELVKMYLREDKKATETRILLNSAIEKLQTSTIRFTQAERARDVAEQARKELEEEQLRRSSAFQKKILDAQKEVEKARRQVADLQFRLNTADDK